MAHGELDTAFQPDGARLEAAVRALDQARLGSGLPQPDRFVYRVEVRDAPGAVATHLTVAEQDLDQTTAWLLGRVLQS
ncbi:hypothetical protein E1218_32775 [Kribbella turkmenica]|uniref:Uncharacterized protein n=2 Tax=Kribbella turkmenica TaxID=2530375 RepID=A0A4R4WLL1_9ACTN|nr:hypothetical protein E1218_32775 [Kribbella turkmenica]